MAGWIKLHRCLLEWEWYDDINVKVTFIHIILSVNHTPKKWRGVDIGRGQMWTSVGSLSKKIGLSEKQIRNSLKKLESTNEIKCQGANNGTMITVCKYDSYQQTEEAVGQANGQTKGKQGANEGQTKGEQRATNKNEKKLKNENNVKEEKEKNGDSVFFENQELNTAFSKWLTMRAEKGKKLTGTSISEVVSSLNAIPEADAAYQITEAIKGGWLKIIDEPKWATSKVKQSRKELAQTAADQKGIDYAEGL